VRLEIGFVAPWPPRGTPGGTPNPPVPRGRRVEGNRVQRGAGSPRCGRAAPGGFGGLTPPWGPRRPGGRAGALHGPRRHLRGSVRGAQGSLRGGIWASPGPPLRRYHPLVVDVPIWNYVPTGVKATGCLVLSVDVMAIGCLCLLPMHCSVLATALRISGPPNGALSNIQRPNPIRYVQYGCCKL
jgi:hypothetical protein